MNEIRCQFSVKQPLSEGFHVNEPYVAAIHGSNEQGEYCSNLERIESAIQIICFTYLTLCSLLQKIATVFAIRHHTAYI